MTTQRSSLLVVALLVVSCVLSSTLLIPGVRPFMAWAAPGDEAAVHAFMALGLLGGALSAPWVARTARGRSDGSKLAALLAAVDALLLAALLGRPPVAWIYALRVLQGASSMSALSLLLGSAPVGEERRGSSAGILGAAVMLGVALGAPLGTLALLWGPTGPVVFGAALQGGVALTLLLVPLAMAERVASRGEGLPWLAMAWVFAERLAIGLFVVTFSLHARGCLALSDVRVGAYFSIFMATFVVFVYPAGALSDRVGSARLAGLGLLTYGAAWLLLASASSSTAALLMPLLGLSSACVYAAALRCAVTSSGAGSRVAAMSGLNAAGAVGMLCGTALAGVVSATLRKEGAPAHLGHELVLQLAGWVQIFAGICTAGVMSFALRQSRLMRS